MHIYCKIKLVIFEISINQNFAFTSFDGNEAVRRIIGVRAAPQRARCGRVAAFNVRTLLIIL